MQDLFTAAKKIDREWEMSGFHFHDSIEILFITGGVCGFIAEGELQYCARGTLLLLKQGLPHMSTSLSEEEYTRYIIRFQPEDLRPFHSGQTDLLAGFRAASPFWRLSEAEIAAVEPLFRSCCSTSEAYGSDLRRNLRFLELLIKLGELSAEERSAAPAEAKSRRSFARVEPVIRYIQAHPTENISLDSVAGRFNYNKHYLCRVFKSAAGVSVGKYIMAVRIQHAAALLRQGDPVQESAAKTGYRSNSTFINCFKKMMGVSPGRYSQQYRRTYEPDQRTEAGSKAQSLKNTCV